MSRVLITGATGLVGRALLPALAARGHEIHSLSRDPSRHSLPSFVQVHPWEALPGVLDGIDILINLAGANIGDRRWSPARKRELVHSRIDGTRRLAASLEHLERRPALWIQASAIGYFGNRGEEPADEGSPPGQGFLAELCQAWEGAADAAGTLGVKVVKLRLGAVLAREGGALPPLVRSFRWGFGSRLGSGDQGFSWIHIQDLVNLILEVMERPPQEGVLNATAPHPCSQAVLARTLAQRLHRPCWPVPAFLTRMGIQLLLGERGKALLLEGAYVRPRRALERGFPFRFPSIEEALRDLV